MQILNFIIYRVWSKLYTILSNICLIQLSILMQISEYAVCPHLYQCSSVSIPAYTYKPSILHLIHLFDCLLVCTHVYLSINFFVSIILHFNGLSNAVFLLKFYLKHWLHCIMQYQVMAWIKQRGSRMHHYFRLLLSMCCDFCQAEASEAKYDKILHLK